MIGRTLAHYKIEKLLGQGGMGQVYRALDTKLERTVALKVLPSHVPSDENKRRFLQEAKAASALDHPNICTIYEINEHRGTMFIAMGYYPGETLKQIIARGPLSVARSVDIAIQIATGLSRAHREGIVHRDIKPANVIVGEDGHVRIIDFGVAKLSDSTGLTKTGSTMGTVAYMSPEQGRGLLVDHQTDIWSLGTILYEMLTGRRPFQGEFEQAVIYCILNEDPTPLSSVVSGVPPALERTVTRALMKDRAKRHQSMDEVLDELVALGLGSHTGPRTAPAVAPPPRKTRARTWFGIGAAIVAGAVAVAAFALWPRGQGERSVAMHERPATTIDSVRTPVNPEPVDEPAETGNESDVTQEANAPTTPATPIPTPAETADKRAQDEEAARVEQRQRRAAVSARDAMKTLETRARGAGAPALAGDAFSSAQARAEEGEVLFADGHFADARKEFERAGELYASAENKAAMVAAAQVDMLAAVRDMLDDVKEQLTPDMETLPEYGRGAKAEAEATASAESDISTSIGLYESAAQSYQAAVDRRSVQRVAIEQLVERYRQSLESESIPMLAALHRHFDDKTKRAWETFFESVKDLKVTTSIEKLHFTDAANAVVDVSAKLAYSGVRDSDADLLWRLVVQESNANRWLINEVVQRPKR